MAKKRRQSASTSRHKKTTRKAVASTKKKLSATKKQTKSARATRKLPVFAKRLRRGKPIKKKNNKKLPRPLFRRHIIEGEGGQLVKIIEPIGYRDFQTKFRRLINDARYRSLRREYPLLTYSIFGHPGNHRMPSLEALVAFFETVYEPTLRAINGSQRKRTEFFANLVIYGVKRSYRVAPPLKNAHGKRRKKDRRGI